MAILATPALTVKYGVAHWEVRALRVWTLQWPRLVKMVVPEKDWPSYFPATFLHRVARLIEFRARHTLTFTNRTTGFEPSAASTKLIEDWAKDAPDGLHGLAGAAPAPF